MKTIEEYIANVNSIGRHESDELELVREKFPYFQAIHILIAKCHKNQNTFGLNKNLKLASLYAGDRKVLYNFINSEEPIAEEVLTEESELEVELPAIEDVKSEEPETVINTELEVDNFVEPDTDVSKVLDEIIDPFLESIEIEEIKEIKNEIKVEENIEIKKPIFEVVEKVPVLKETPVTIETNDLDKFPSEIENLTTEPEVNALDILINDETHSTNNILEEVGVEAEIIDHKFELETETGALDKEEILDEAHLIVENEIVQNADSIPLIEDPITEIANPITEIADPVKEILNPFIETENSIVEIENPIKETVNLITEIEDSMTIINNEEVEIIENEVLTPTENSLIENELEAEDLVIEPSENSEPLVVLTEVVDEPEKINIEETLTTEDTLDFGNWLDSFKLEEVKVTATEKPIKTDIDYLHKTDLIDPFEDDKEPVLENEPKLKVDLIEEEEDTEYNPAAWAEIAYDIQAFVNLPDVKEEKEFTFKKANKKEIDDLLEKFIKKSPSISRPKVELYKPENMAKKSEEFNSEVISETLANLFYKQKHLHKALEMYEKLILHYPDKKEIFAARIKSIKEELINQL